MSAGEEKIGQPSNNKEQNQEDKWDATQVARTCLGIILLSLGIGLSYLAALWIVGLLPHDELGRRNYIAGASLTILVVTVVSVMGESLIEDIVKFVFFAGAAAVIFLSYGAAVQSLIIAVPVGAGLPFLVRSIAARMK